MIFRKWEGGLKPFRMVSWRHYISLLPKHNLKFKMLMLPAVEMSPNRKKQSWRALHTQAFKNNLLATNIQSQLKLIEPRGPFHPGVKKLIKDRRPRYNDLLLTFSKVNPRPRPVIGWLEPLFASLSLIGRSSPCYPLGPLSSKSPGTSRLGPQLRHGRI